MYMYGLKFILLERNACRKVTLALPVFLRKADGVVVMYDLTNDQSFLNVMDWITSVKVCLLTANFNNFKYCTWYFIFPFPSSV